MKILAVSIALLFFFAPSISKAGPPPHWEYEGENGPEHWGSLDTSFRTCATGRCQSPIDIQDTVNEHLDKIIFHYGRDGINAANEKIINNGHTIQVNFRPGNSIVIDDHRFELKQFHFHTPSENHIAGKSFPMEAHFVHADAHGKIAVIGVMIEEGQANKEITALWSAMPQDVNKAHPLKAPVKLDELLPTERSYFRFAGSLTTPPCSEGVIWLVLKNSVTASKEQTARFLAVLHHPDNRPLQARNGRLISEQK